MINGGYFLGHMIDRKSQPSCHTCGCYYQLFKGWMNGWQQGTLQPKLSTWHVCCTWKLYQVCPQENVWGATSVKMWWRRWTLLWTVPWISSALLHVLAWRPSQVCMQGCQPCVCRHGL